MNRLLLLLLALVASSPAWCLTRTGHEIVGAIAEQLLAGTAAERRVRAVLPANESLATAALWADCVKSVEEKPPYRYLADPRYPECEQFATPVGQREMSSYVRRNLSACRPQAGQESCHRQYHYVNLATQRERYEATYVGASDHDVVAALQACIAVLRGKPSPAPFNLRRRDALRLLAHLVGDIHQPLHVGSVYLARDGQPLDPDASGALPESFTAGGNRIRVGSQNLHAIWDAVPPSLGTAAFLTPGTRAAREVTATSGPAGTWAQQWASESVQASHRAFDGIAFAPVAGSTVPAWTATLPAGYEALRETIQREQIVRAGARLSQVLQAIWPE